MYEEPKVMTARELLRALETLTEEQKDLPVYTQGCDCDGDLKGVEVIQGDYRLDGKDCIYLTRSN